MKKRISDLLDTYWDDSVKVSGETPLSSARIKELTMKKITESKKPTLRRAPLRLLAAAAVAAALTASAFAAVYIAGAGDLMQGFFTKDGGPLSSGQVEALDQIGQTFDGSVTDNGATLTPIAAIADENCYYLRLRIEAPEGVVLPDLDPDTEGFYQLGGTQSPEEGMTFTADNGEAAKGFGVSLEWQPDSDPTDNVKEVVIRCTALGMEPAVFNDNVPKTLTIHGLWIQSPYKEYTPVFTGEFALDVGSHFESRSLTVDCGGADYQDQTGYGYTMWLDKVTLSPLSATVWYRSNVNQRGSEFIGVGIEGMQIVLKDGTVFFDTVPWWENDVESGWDADAMLADGPVESGDLYALFDQPLDLDQVDHIKFGDHVIPIVAE